ncbi:hypothetical protein OROGR_026119 [Orobanche gracilis]
MGRKKPTGRDEETGPAPEENVAPVGNKKKGKKAGLMKIGLKDDDDDGVRDSEAGEEKMEEEEDAPVINLAGKMKSKFKGKKSGTNSAFSSSAFGLLGEDEEEGDDEMKDNDDEDEVGEPVIAFSGKKKPSKGKKGGGSVSSAFELLDEEEESKDKAESFEYEEENVGITFTGKKKKSSKGLKKASGNSFSAVVLDEENDEDASVSKIGDDMTGGDHEEDVSAVKFSGKKKSSKKKNIIINAEVENGDASSGVIEPDQPSDESKTKKQTTEDVADTSKNKMKKKKKGGRTGQEEDDLDRILAELGAIPAESKRIPTSLVNAVIPPPEGNAELDQEKEGPVESVASKKKKKKKEKEKEKKAAAREEKQKEADTEAGNKLVGKKIPPHVREMQEKLARLREAEEKKKREEEERLRKEEEERLRREEEERIAEEKKRLKKEKEKEKLLKKKQEGKLLTGKQKEEARRLEAMRRQILANANLQLSTGETAEAPVKRPMYQKKKPKPHAQSNGAAILDSVEGTDSKQNQQELVPGLDILEGENSEDVASSGDKTDATNVNQENVVEEEEEDDDEEEEWDAKSWDDADLKLPEKSAFSDEEVDSEPEPLVKKEMKNARAAAQDVELPPVSSKTVGLSQKNYSKMPQRSENVDVKKKNSEAEESNKNSIDIPVNPSKNRKVIVKQERQKSDDHPAQSGQNLRSPICCIMGHVDTGKTKLLDCIRGTNVQEGEAGGITQQIGATYFPAENIRERTRELKADATLKVPGLLVIDTPGHESFTNLRSRGSGLCDIAILVVDIMHGLEPQTIESLNLLKMRNTDFIVALNKVDRLYGWRTCRNAPIKKALAQQTKDVEILFNDGVKKVKNQLQEQGLNTELYYKNKEMGDTFNIVPTSAISGEGIPDLLLLLVQWSQRTMVERLTYSNEVQCTVLEVKVVEGHGTTVDVVLVNGVLHEGDQIVVCGMNEPIVTTIRALLTPHPMKELRVKGTYLHHKEIKAAMGIKITGQGLDHAIAGTSLYVVGPQDDLEDIKEAAMEDMKSVMNRIDKSGEGVYVQASTLGSLEALLEFLKTPAVNIPVSGISIGPVHKKDVIRASVMLEKKKEYATILAFDVKVTQEARELADELGVKIFIADIIYHLFDQFKAYIDNLKEEKKKEAADEAVFPCVLKIMPNCVFNKKDPIVLGVNVLEGVAKIGTPLCVPQKDFVEIGRIISIENNHRPVDDAKKGQKVAIKIVSSNVEQQKIFGRHFEIEDELVSKVSRNSLDALKENYKDDLSNEDMKLLFKLKKLFKIL